MSFSRTAASAPSTERRTKPRLRGRRRALTVTSVLLALLGGVVAESGTAMAQPIPGSCTQTCNHPPAGVNRGPWNQALEAASFWANHSIDFNQVDRSGIYGYYHLDHWAGRGWPSASFGGQWFGYWESTVGGTRFVYYGGTFHDHGGLVSRAERARGVSSSRAYSTGNGRTSPYVEYDISYYNAPTSRRGTWRIVRNSRTGNVFVTYDHYQTFHYLGHF